MLVQHDLVCNNHRLYGAELLPLCHYCECQWATAADHVVCAGWQASHVMQPTLQQDGVFRAVPQGLSNAPSSVASKGGIWTATLNLAGELYRAHFDSQDAALEAYHAAGAVS